jgi:hypothetical protein
MAKTQKLGKTELSFFCTAVLFTIQNNAPDKYSGRTDGQSSDFMLTLRGA